MDSPGITVRPIITLDMHDEFCETFFDNVRVPSANLVGQLNKGWTMAKALLGFERIFIGSPKLSAYALRRLKLLAERMGVWDDAVFQDRYTRLRLDLDRPARAVPDLSSRSCAAARRSAPTSRC